VEPAENVPFLPWSGSKAFGKSQVLRRMTSRARQTGQTECHAQQDHLTYRLNSPNNNVKIWDQDISRGKLFTFRDLWDMDGEGIGA
jgi:hypothetical protein